MRMWNTGRRLLSMNIAFRKTDPEYEHLGAWEAQVIGLPQARCYGVSSAEAIGYLIFAFGKEQCADKGIEFCDSSEMQNQRVQS